MTISTLSYGEASAWTYLDNGWGATQSAGGVVQTAYAYNARGLCTEIQNRRADNSLLSDFAGPDSRGILYDAAGNMAAEQDTMTTALHPFSG